MMKSQSVIMVVAAIVIMALAVVALRQNGQLSEATTSLSLEKIRNAELQGKVTSLVAEVAKLKETADHYYQQGVDLQSSGNLADAKAAFEAVVAKFPTSNLVGSAQQRLAAVNEATAKAEAEKAAEAQRQREQQEAMERLMGTPMDYATFYAKANSTGLPIGKRFRVEPVAFSPDMMQFNQQGTLGAKFLIGFVSVKPDFDDTNQQEQVLKKALGKTGGLVTCGVVVSMGDDRRVHIRRAENCE
jgi:hypothetical protein